MAAPGRKAGVGIALDIAPHWVPGSDIGRYIYVSSLAQGWSAECSGEIKEGDYVVSVDGNDVADHSCSDVGNLLCGREGSEVLVGFRRISGNGKQSFDFQVLLSRTLSPSGAADVDSASAHKPPLPGNDMHSQTLTGPKRNVSDWIALQSEPPPPPGHPSPRPSLASTAASHSPRRRSPRVAVWMPEVPGGTHLTLPADLAAFIPEHGQQPPPARPEPAAFVPEHSSLAGSSSRLSRGTTFAGSASDPASGSAASLAASSSVHVSASAGSSSRFALSEPVMSGPLEDPLETHPQPLLQRRRALPPSPPSPSPSPANPEPATQPPASQPAASSSSAAAAAAPDFPSLPPRHQHPASADSTSLPSEDAAASSAGDLRPPPKPEPLGIPRLGLLAPPALDLQSMPSSSAPAAAPALPNPAHVTNSIHVTSADCSAEPEAEARGAQGLSTGEDPEARGRRFSQRRSLPDIALPDPPLAQLTLPPALTPVAVTPYPAHHPTPGRLNRTLSPVPTSLDSTTSSGDPTPHSTRSAPAYHGSAHGRPPERLAAEGRTALIPAVTSAHFSASNASMLSIDEDEPAMPHHGRVPRRLSAGDGHPRRLSSGPPDLELDVVAEAVWFERASFRAKSHAPRSEFGASVASSQMLSTQSPRRSAGGRSGAGGRRRTGPKRTRVHRAHYSAWEAFTHVPKIKESWALIMQRTNFEQLGILMYDKMLEALPDLAASLACSDKMVIAKKLSDMLNTIVGTVDSTSLEVREQIQRLAGLHLKKGVRESHMQPMGTLLVAVVADVLGSDFGTELEAAWRWLWNWLAGAMSEALVDARLEASAISRSWDLACDRNSDDEIGGLLCDALAQFAPNMSAHFSIPRQILAPRFFEMLSTLRSFYKDPDRSGEQLRWLAMRHIKYNARPEHVTTFGHCIVAAMEKAVGEDEWTSPMAEAWRQLWLEQSSAMMETMVQAQQFGEPVRSVWQRFSDMSSPVRFGEVLQRELKVVRAIWRMFVEHNTWDSASLRARILKATFLAWRHHPPSRKTSVASVESLLTPTSAHGEAEGADVDHEPSSRGTRPQSPLLPRLHPELLKGGYRHRLKPQSSGPGRRRSIVEEEGGGSLELKPAEEMGRHFWQLLTSLLALMWEPETQNERMMIAAKELFEWGLHEKDLSVLGLAIGNSLRKTLGKEWTALDRDAWEWFWGYIKDVLGRMLLDCEKQSALLLQESWDLIRQEVSLEGLADMFFEELSLVAPHIVHLFKLPRKMQGIRMEAIFDLLINFFGDPEAFFTSFKRLAMRHISYGVKADMTKPFGQALVACIRRAAEGRLSGEMETAWISIWTRASACVTRTLAVASNLVVVALVQGDEEKLRNALECAPRQERWWWLLRVQVNGEMVSPLYWAVRDGRSQMAKAMLIDILAIRADRTGYYYGAKDLWDSHPDVVAVLAENCPALLWTLLDGLMWQAANVEDGKIRVNYYVAELYGNPTKFKDVWQAPLGTLVLREELVDVFRHPVVCKLLDLKWNGFARNYFLLKVVWFGLLLGMFMAGYLHWGCCAMAPLRLLLGVAALGTLLWMAMVVVEQWMRGQVQLRDLGVARVRVPLFLADSWNLSRFAACGLLSVLAALEPCILRRVVRGAAGAEGLLQEWGAQCQGGDARLELLAMGGGWQTVVEGSKALAAVTSILLWVQLLQAFSFSNTLSAFAYTLAVMFQDVSHNLVVIGIFLAAFGTALTLLEEPPAFTSLEQSLLVLVREVLNLDHQSLDQTSHLGGLLLFAFSTVTSVGMLNMLIAQLSLAYERVADRKVGFALKHRAALCTDVEAVLPLAKRQMLFDSFGFDKPVEFGTGDDGPEGGVQVLEPASLREDPQYRPDRILRFTEYDASPKDPWPAHNVETGAILAYHEPGAEPDSEKLKHQGEEAPLFTPIAAAARHFEDEPLDSDGLTRARS